MCTHAPGCSISFCLLQTLGALLEKLDFAAMMSDEIKDVCESKFVYEILLYVARYM